MMKADYKYLEVIVKDEYEEIRAHTEKVVCICKAFIRELDCDIDEDLLIEAAGFHDIAKFKKDGSKNEKHHKLAKKVIKENGWFKDEDFQGDVCDIIKAHRKKFDPKECVAKEAAILRMADKLDKFRKGADDAEDRCCKNIAKIQEYFRSDKEFWNKFEKVYKSELDKARNKDKGDESSSALTK